MNIGDIQVILEGLDREKARLQDRLSEIDRDRGSLLAQLSELQRLASKYNIGGAPVYVPTPQNSFKGTVRELCHAYLTHPDSPIHKLRHATRQNYASLLKRIEETFGDVSIGDLTEDHIIKMHDLWSDHGARAPMGHATITMFRTLAVFGTDVLKDDRAQRLSYILHRMKFKAPQPRTVDITLEQSNAIIAKANDLGLHSIGLAQALQFWTPLWQKDCIGEYVPITEPEPSSVIVDDMKWIRGITWEQIDADNVLHHTTSKHAHELHIRLNDYPGVINQMKFVPRKMTGPIIISEKIRVPWRAGEFRRYWRKIARLCDIPNDVKNRDSGMNDSDLDTDSD